LESRPFAASRKIIAVICLVVSIVPAKRRRRDIFLFRYAALKMFAMRFYKDAAPDG
jgi:hypothetical protein